MFNDNSNSRKRMHEIQAMPLYQKAREISYLAHHLAESIDKTDLEEQDDLDREILEDIASDFLKNSFDIPSLILRAEIVSFYAIKMENAVIIRKTAQELLRDLDEFETLGFQETEYLNILRDEIESFRHLFVQWVKTFDPEVYMIDRWGIFNPPGVDYDEFDPNEESFDYEDILFNFFEDDLDEDTDCWHGDYMDDDESESDGEEEDF